MASSCRMRCLMNAWPTRFISALAAVSRHHVLHRVARTQVVDDGGAGVLEQKGFGEQCGDEIARDELAAAVDEEAAVRVAVPGDADVGPLADDLRGDVAAVLLDQRIGFVIGETCRRSRSRAWCVAGQPIEQLGATRPAMPLPASSTTLNGLIAASSMNDITLFDIVGEGRHAARDRAASRPPAAAADRSRSCRGCRRFPHRR